MGEARTIYAMAFSVPDTEDPVQFAQYVKDSYPQQGWLIFREGGSFVAKPARGLPVGKVFLEV